MVILALALIVLGPEKLPQVAKQIARFIGELKRASEEFKKELEIDKLDDLKDPVQIDKLLGEDITEILKNQRPGGPGFLNGGHEDTRTGASATERKEDVEGRKRDSL